MKMMMMKTSMWMKEDDKRDYVCELGFLMKKKT